MTIGTAIISRCGNYRYRLERKIGDRATTLAAVMANPSTADANVDDPTIRRWLGFAARLKVGHLLVGNKFAYRSPNIRDVGKVSDPVGPENDLHLRRIFCEADFAIVGWGPLGKFPPPLRNRWRRVVELADEAGCRLFCLGTAKDGHPRHPLMLSYDATLMTWSIPR